MLLIVGATSKVGMHAIPMLLEKGYAVRAMTRTPEKAQVLKNMGVEVVQGDLLAPASLARACEGVEQVLAAAHGFAPGDKHNNIHTVDDLGNRSLIDAAAAAGVRQFVFVSILGAKPDSPMELFRIKYGIEQHLKYSGMTYTILRAAAFMETWAVMVGEPIIKTGKTTIFGSGKNPVNFVSAEDVAKYCVIALEDSRASCEVINVGGPENLTFLQVAEIFEKCSGRQAKKNHVPVPVMRVMRVLTKPFNPLLSLQVTGGILMATTDQSFDMRKTLEKYPVQLARMEEVAQRMVK